MIQKLFLKFYRFLKINYSYFIPQINEHFTNIDNRTKESTAYLQTLISENLNNIKSYLEKITEDVLSKTTQSIYENNRQFKYEISEHISQCKMKKYKIHLEKILQKLINKYNY